MSETRYVFLVSYVSNKMSKFTTEFSLMDLDRLKEIRKCHRGLMLHRSQLRKMNKEQQSNAHGLKRSALLNGYGTEDSDFSGFVNIWSYHAYSIICCPVVTEHKHSLCIEEKLVLHHTHPYALITRLSCQCTFICSNFEIMVPASYL